MFQFGFEKWPISGSLLETLRRLCWRFFVDNSSHARGLRLLRKWLSLDQQAQFDREGYFDIVGCDTGKKYRIHQGTAMNVHELDEAGRIRTVWCFVPVGSLVAGDVMLAQKIALETFECGALLVANRFAPIEKSYSRTESDLPY
jgi:hypothetical protein